MSVFGWLVCWICHAGDWTRGLTGAKHALYNWAIFPLLSIKSQSERYFSVYLKLHVFLRCITSLGTFKILPDRPFQLKMKTDNVFLQNQNSVLHSLVDLAQPPGLRGTPTWLHHFLIELWIRIGKLGISQFAMFVTVESSGKQCLAGGTLLKGSGGPLKSVLSIGPFIFPCRPYEQIVPFSEAAFSHIVGTRARH